MTGRRLVLLPVVLEMGLSAGVAAQEVPRPDPAPAAPAAATAHRPWNEVETSWISVRLGMALLEDGAFYSQNAASIHQVGNIPSEALFRVDDLSLSGEIKLPHPWRYEVSGNYKGLDPTDTRGWTFTNINVSIPLGAFGSVTVGKQKEGVGMEMMANARDLPFMEHSTMTTAATFVGSHVVGVRLFGSPMAGRLTWSVGWFNNWLEDGKSASQSGNIFAGRVTGLAVEEHGGSRLLHLGASAVYRESQDGRFRSKSVPEVYEAPDFVDTGSFPADHATSYSAELAAAEGLVTLSGEVTRTSVSAPEKGNPEFYGFYVMASWTITGERRPYRHATGTFGAISPASPFSFRHGGSGAWELAARYSGVDLTSGAIQGGRFDRLSGAISWRPTRPWRLEFNYGYGTLDRFGLRGRTRFYQLRLQFEL